MDDFLAVSENHILEDVNKCCLALQEGDSETLDRIAGAIRGRRLITLKYKINNNKNPRPQLADRGRGGGGDGQLRAGAVHREGPGGRQGSQGGVHPGLLPPGGLKI